MAISAIKNLPETLDKINTYANSTTTNAFIARRSPIVFHAADSAGFTRINRRMAFSDGRLITAGEIVSFFLRSAKKAGKNR
jgi:hypothetical protein